MLPLPSDTGPFVYQDDKLQYVFNSEGRCRWQPDSSKFKYDYFVKDHLGNVRSTVTADQGGINEFFNTNEIAVAPLESKFFDGIAPVRDDNPVTSNPNDVKSSRLNGSDPARRIGPSLLVKVMSGDVFDVSCNSYYEEGTGNDNVAADAGSMMQSIIGTLSGSGIGSGFTTGEGVNPNEYATRLFTPDNYLNVYDALKEQSTNPSLPRAYLNYIVFDENMQIVPEESGAIQIAAGANGWRSLSTNGSIKIGRNGYLTVYVSNEQFHDIYFDNLYLRHSHGRLLQEEQYYPHGLAVNMGSNTPLDNNFQYQSNEKHDELGIGLSDFHARQYDAQLGRFVNLDPMNEFASGYIGMGNNPANLVDPMGTMANGGGIGSNDIHGIKYTQTDFEWMDGIPRTTFVHLNQAGGGYRQITIAEMTPGQGITTVFNLGEPAGQDSKTGAWGINMLITRFTVTYPDNYPQSGYPQLSGEVINKWMPINPVMQMYVDYAFNNNTDHSFIDDWDDKSRAFGNSFANAATPIPQMAVDYMDKNHHADALEHYKYEGELGFKNYGWPTMVKTWGVLATVVSGGTLGLDFNAYMGSSIMGTVEAKQGWDLVWGATSLSIGGVNTRNALMNDTSGPANFMNYRAGGIADAVDAVKYVSPIGMFNWGVRIADGGINHNINNYYR